MPLSPSRQDTLAGERTRVWLLFQLNLLHPAIEEEARPLVIERCYWPLLRTVESCRVPIGLEMTGSTLAAIDRLDPSWVAKLRELAAAALIEPIASGEAQIIGPLVPAIVNAANFRLGNDTYERLLGRRPALVLVNEQCLSQSLVDHYIDAGFSGFIADWDAVHLANPGWDPALRHTPRLALSVTNRTLPVLWNMTVAGEKFQRHAAGRDDRAAYWQWLDRQLAKRVPSLNLYCDVAELFMARPAAVGGEPSDSAWGIIENLFLDLRQDRRIACAHPSEILASLPPTDTAPLPVATAAMPLPTKQQGKGNVLRWAVTGRDDIGINSRCLALARRLRDSLSATDEDWRELCRLYACEFRAPIGDRRWAAYRERLSTFERRWNHGGIAPLGTLRQPNKDGMRLEPRADGIICLESKTLGVELNAQRGLAIHRLWRDSDPQRWLLGTVPFGYYDDIRLRTDFFSTHLAFQQPGKTQLTDLLPVEAWLFEEPEWLSIYAEAVTAFGPVEKELRLHRNVPRLDLLYRLSWPALPLGALRLAHLTVNPDAFNPDTLWYATHNGGAKQERFPLNGAEFDHGRPDWPMVSANAALGMTEDTLRFGDDRHALTVTARREQAAIVPMVSWRRLRENFFFCIAFSAGEINDTIAKDETSRAEHWPLTVALSLTLDAAA